MGFIVANGSTLTTLGPSSTVQANGQQILQVYMNGVLDWTFDLFYASWSADWVGGNYPSTSEYGVDTSGSLYRAVIQDVAIDIIPKYGGWLSVSATTGSLGYTSSTATSSNGSKFVVVPNFNTITWQFFDGASWYTVNGSCSFDARGGGFTGSATLALDPSMGFFTSGGAIKCVIAGVSSKWAYLT